MADFFNKTKELSGAARFRLSEIAKDLFFSRKKVWCRSACLGKEVFTLVYGEKNYKLVNMQKARVDLLLNWITGRAQRPKASAVKPYMKRSDVYPFIKEQTKLPWPRANEDFEFLLMDSYSELTDQKFNDKIQGWSFCCHWSDINHESDFDSRFACDGLLPADQFRPAYQNFFSWFFEIYPEKNVYFMHYPSKLDEKEKFKQRGAAILEAILELAIEYPQIKNLSVPEELVDYNESDRLPYHYSKKTNYAMAAVWRAQI